MYFKLFNKTGKRWEVPTYNPRSGNDYERIVVKGMGLNFTDKQFSFEIKDPLEEAFVSSMEYKNCTLNYTDKYIQFGLWFPAERIFGLDERVTEDFELCDSDEQCLYAIFAKDAASPLDGGSESGGKNMYGHQPFYLIQLFDDRFVGVLFLNSNAQDVVIFKPFYGLNVYYRTTGGILDFYFFYPNSPEFVLEKILIVMSMYS